MLLYDGVQAFETVIDLGDQIGGTELFAHGGEAFEIGEKHSGVREAARVRTPLLLQFGRHFFRQNVVQQFITAVPFALDRVLGAAGVAQPPKKSTGDHHRNDNGEDEETTAGTLPRHLAIRVQLALEVGLGAYQTVADLLFLEVAREFEARYLLAVVHYVQRVIQGEEVALRIVGFVEVTGLRVCAHEAARTLFALGEQADAFRHRQALGARGDGILRATLL